MKSSKVVVLGASLGFLISVVTAFTATAQNLEKLAAADNGFAFDLLKQIAVEQPGQNIFISPFSVSTALEMVGDGAAGETKTEMQRVLKTDALSPADLNAACKALNQSLVSQTNVILNLADGIWYQDGFHLKTNFVADNQNYFQAALDAVDFDSPKSADVINAWADQATRGKIQNVVQYPFPDATRVVLANAIYFKGNWAEQFDAKLTKPQDFYPAGGVVKQVPMMSKTKKFNYQENKDFQAVELPYAGNRLRMYLFLPATNSSPQQLLAGFNGDDWHGKILTGFLQREGTLVFPRFKLDYDVTLNDPLQALGMKRAFDPQAADFSAMADEPLFIGMVKQKSYVAVDEFGTEAAAVTTVVMTMSAVEEPQEPFQMIVDRPFLFVIADGDTQAILFMGIVNSPAQ
ncbi:MAG TPA: serpin family protein [Verrucomicrobiae bacterium]|nr:serpin family protein [Verrucomicrobiae bacterium]